MPFPHDPLPELSTALETVTEQLFKVPPNLAEWNGEAESDNPLSGAFRSGMCWLQGSHLYSTADAAAEEEAWFVFPSGRTNNPEQWPIGSLVHIDQMMRSHVLTRLKGRERGEYTRYRAEANAVVIIPGSKIAEEIGEPVRRDYVDPELEVQTDGAEQIAQGDTSAQERDASAGPCTDAGVLDDVPREPSAVPISTMSDALDAIRNEEFESGIEYFETLVEKRSNYHVAWLRLGHAYRELAARQPDENRMRAAALLTKSVGALTQAENHSDREYQALAHYEKSKTLFRMTRLVLADSVSWALSLDEAIRACELSTERKFQTWLEYLRALPSPNSVAKPNHQVQVRWLVHDERTLSVELRNVTSEPVACSAKVESLRPWTRGTFVRDGEPETATILAKQTINPLTPIVVALIHDRGDRFVVLPGAGELERSFVAPWRIGLAFSTPQKSYTHELFFRWNPRLAPANDPRGAEDGEGRELEVGLTL